MPPAESPPSDAAAIAAAVVQATVDRTLGLLTGQLDAYSKQLTRLEYMLTDNTKINAQIMQALTSLELRVKRLEEAGETARKERETAHSDRRSTWESLINMVGVLVAAVLGGLVGRWTKP